MVAREKRAIVAGTEGYRSDLPMQLLPLGSLFSSSNIIYRDGTYQTRPGYAAFHTSASERVVGIKFWRAVNEASDMVMVTKTKIYGENAGFTAFADITGTALTGGDTDYARAVVFQSGGANNVIITNNVNLVQAWNGAAATASDITNAPICKDICVASNRLIAANVVESGTRSPSRIRCSDFNDYTAWTSTNTFDVIDTDDNIVCVKSLTRTGFAIYKAASQHIGIAGSGVFPFSFELVARQPGPASVNAVVDVGTVHFYFGQDGSFYAFDGQNCQEIGQKIRTYIRTNMNWSNRDRIHGVYYQDLKTIVWFYPTTTSTDCDSAIAMQMLEGGGFAWWPWVMGHQMTASCPYTAKASTSIGDLSGTIGALTGTIGELGGRATMVEFVADKNGQVYTAGAATSDAGTSITASWQIPALPWAGEGKAIVAHSYETSFKKTAAAQNIDLQFGATDTLMADPTLQTATTVDISTDAQKRMDTSGLTNQILRTRFLTIKQSYTTTQLIEWRSGLLAFDYQEIS